MKHWKTKRAVLPRELRLRIVHRVNAGEDRQAVAKDLGVDLVAVHKAVAWAKHVRARNDPAKHQAAAMEMRERMGGQR
ncbi:MAG: hypothetical protein HYX73_01185 [Acidobacteria bacterium]|nr:hypothetical protein [Acidobacteriota bacterium]